MARTGIILSKLQETDARYRKQRTAQFTCILCGLPLSNFDARAARKLLKEHPEQANNFQAVCDRQGLHS